MTENTIAEYPVDADLEEQDLAAENGGQDMDGPIFDLASLDTATAGAEGRWMTAVNPDTGDEIPVKVLVYGEDSRAYVRAMDAVGRHRVEAQKRNRGRAKKGEGFSYSELREGGVIIASHLTKDWTGVYLNGEAVPCTRESKLEIFAKFDWLADQVVRFSRDRSNFLAS